MGIDFKVLASSVLGFTLALSWNTAASKALQYYFPHENEVFQYFICTMILTIVILIIVAIYNKITDGGGEPGFGIVKL